MGNQCKKVNFGSEEFANFSLKKIRASSTRKVLPVRAYKCKCGSWHLTSKPDVFMLQKENDILKEEVKSNISTIKELKDSIKTIEKRINKEENIEVKKDKRILELQKAMAKRDETIADLRKTRDQLIFQVNNKTP